MSSESILFTNCAIADGSPVEGAPHAVGVRAERVVAVGDPETVRSAVGPTPRMIDLLGGVVLPGFDDCHMHILSLGLNLRLINVTQSAAPTIAVIQARVRERAGRSSDGSWLLGRGYNQNLLAEARHPSRDELDVPASGRPVALWHTSGHVLAVNSLALELAGITDDTLDPDGGEIERDHHGRPTGVLKETAMELVRRVLPQPSIQDCRDAVADAAAALTAEGITSASDAATGQTLPLADEMTAYAAAVASGNCPTRMTLMPRIQLLGDPGSDEPLPSPQAYRLEVDSHLVRVGATKIFSDGALTTRTAAVRQPYVDTGGRGLLTWEPDQLERLIRRAHEAGWQIATHAIGDRAIETALDAYERAQGTASRPDPRHRIEHVTLPDPAQIGRMARLGIVAVLQPEDIAVLGDAYPPALGDFRAANNSPVAWFRRLGVRVAFSSDRPVTPGNPLMGVRAAEERRTAGGVQLGPEHCTTAMEAVRFYSEGSAYATCSEMDKGQLRPGLLADFVVLDRDITTIAPEDITGARVVRTIVGGRIVFEA